MAVSAAEISILLKAQDLASPEIAKVSGELNKLGPAGTSATSALSGVGGALAKVAAVAATAGIVALGGALVGVVTSAASFEKQMSAVGAVAGATAGEMKSLTGLALQLGKDTSFSASEAAKGLEELVKAGVSVGDVMSGAGKAALDLAAAGAISVGDAAEIAANAMNVFGIEGSKMTHVADMIAGAASASSISVNDYKFSLGAAGAVAHTMGFEFDDLTVAIAAMGNAGIKGSDAGTSLKTMMLNLSPASKAAMFELKNLGIVTLDNAAIMEQAARWNLDLSGTIEDVTQRLFMSVTGWKEGTTVTQAQTKAWADAQKSLGLTRNAFFDAEGKVKSFRDISEILKNSLVGLTREQQINAIKTIFGTDAIRSAAILAELGAEKYDVLAASIGKVTAAQVAETRLNNLAGSLEKLKGSLETAAITLGTLLLPALKGLADSATEHVNTVIGMFEQLPDAWATIQEVFARNWSPDAAIHPLVNAIGEIAIVIRDDVMPVAQRFIDFFANLPEPVKAAATAFAAVIAAGIALSTALAILSPLFTAIGIGLAIILSPLGAVAAAVALLTAIWVTNFGNIQSKTQQLLAVVGPAFTTIATEASKVPEKIDAIITKIGEFLGVSLEGAVGPWERLGLVIEASTIKITEAVNRFQVESDRAVEQSGKSTEELNTIWLEAQGITDTSSGGMIASLQRLAEGFAATWARVQADSALYNEVWMGGNGIVPATDQGASAVLTTLDGWIRSFATAVATINTEGTAPYNAMWLEMNGVTVRESGNIVTIISGWARSIGETIAAANTTNIGIINTFWADANGATTGGTSIIGAALAAWWASIQAGWTAWSATTVQINNTFWADAQGSAATGTSVILQTVTTWMTNTGAAIGDGWAAILASIAAAWASIIAAVTAGVAGALAAVTGSVGEWVAAGTALGQGIVTGVSTALANLVETVMAPIRGAISAVKSALSNLPSTSSITGGASTTGSTPLSYQATDAGGFASNEERLQFLREEAARRGHNPNTVERVGRSEGAGAAGPVGDSGQSFGALQAYTGPGGGQGTEFMRQTGLDPSNPNNEKALVRWQLDRLGQTGWQPFHGAQAAGIGNWEGINTAPPSGPGMMPKLPLGPNPATGPFALPGGAVRTGMTAEELQQIIDLGPPWEQAMTAIQTTGQTAFRGVGQAVTMTASTSTVAVRDMGDQIATTMKDASGNLTTIIQDTSGNVIGIFNEMADGSKLGMSTMGQGILTSAQEAGGGVVTTFKDASGQMLSAVVDGNGQVVTSYVSMGQTLATTAATTATTVLASVDTMKGGSIAAALAAHNGVTGSFAAMATGVNTSVTDMGTATVTRMQDTGGQVLGSVVSANGQVLSAYANLADGSQTSFSTMQQGVTTTVTDMGNGIVTRMQDASGNYIGVVVDTSGKVLNEFAGVATGVTASMSTTATSAEEGFGRASEAADKVIEPLDGATTGFEHTGSASRSAVTPIEDVASAMASVKPINIGDTVKNLEAVRKAATSAATALDKVAEAGKSVGGSGGSGSEEHSGSKSGGGKARGGSVLAGVGYIVGEQGPEFFIPGSGGTILPNGGSGDVASLVGGSNEAGLGLLQQIIEAVRQGAASIVQAITSLGRVAAPTTPRSPTTPAPTAPGAPRTPAPSVPRPPSTLPVIVDPENAQSLERYFSVIARDGDWLNDWLTHLSSTVAGPAQTLGQLVAGLGTVEGGDNAENLQKYFTAIANDGDWLNDWLTHLSASVIGPAQTLGRLVAELGPVPSDQQPVARPPEPIPGVRPRQPVIEQPLPGMRQTVTQAKAMATGVTAAAQTMSTQTSAATIRMVNGVVVQSKAMQDDVIASTALMRDGVVGSAIRMKDGAVVASDLMKTGVTGGIALMKTIASGDAEDMNTRVSSWANILHGNVVLSMAKMNLEGVAESGTMETQVVERVARMNLNASIEAAKMQGNVKVDVDTMRSNAEAASRGMRDDVTLHANTTKTNMDLAMVGVKGALQVLTGPQPGPPNGGAIGSVVVGFGTVKTTAATIAENPPSFSKWVTAIEKIKKAAEDAKKAIENIPEAPGSSSRSAASAVAVGPVATARDISASANDVIDYDKLAAALARVRGGNTYALTVNTTAPYEPIVADFAIMRSMAGAAT